MVTCETLFRIFALLLSPLILSGCAPPAASSRPPQSFEEPIVPRLLQGLLRSFVESEAAGAVKQYLANVKRVLEEGTLS